MIHNDLPAIMDRKGISIRQLSRLTGITYTTIRAMVQGQRRSIQLEVLDAVCEALDIQPGDIYRRVVRVETPPPVQQNLALSPPAARAERQTQPAVHQDAGGDWRAW
jgi:putative transcriptional regulator